MKVLQLNCVYRKGSTGRIVDDIHNELIKKGHDSVICYGRGARYHEENIYKVSSELGAKIHSLLSLLFGVRFGFSSFSTLNVIKIIKKEKPDVVHLHCLNSNFVNVYRLLEFLKRNKIKTVLTLHAEIMHTAGCEHACECEKWKTECSSCAEVRGILSRFFRDDARYCYRRMKKAIDNFTSLTIVGVSDWVSDRAKKSPITKDRKICTVNNGIDTNVFYPRNYGDLKKQLGINEDKKIILHATPNFKHPLKGGKYVIELAERMPEYQFVIVGFNDDAQLLPKNVIPIKHTKNTTELAQLYSMADVVLLTSKRETFSMIVAEALSCGTPVVGFRAGAPETVALPQYSAFVEQANTEALRKATLEMLEKNLKLPEEAVAMYGRSKMFESYLKIYEEA